MVIATLAAIFYSAKSDLLTADFEVGV